MIQILADNITTVILFFALMLALYGLVCSMRNARELEYQKYDLMRRMGMKDAELKALRKDGTK